MPRVQYYLSMAQTYASTLTFDYEIEGASWMDQLAQQGFDTWCIDLLGYGCSDRPKAMNEPAEDHPPDL